MPLGAHLRELRRRLAISLSAVAVGTIAGWLASEPVWLALEGPVRQVASAQSHNAQLVFPTITSAFDLRLQIALYAGIVLASPVWLYQSFAYFVPGLTRRERRYAIGFTMSAIPLFVAGCAAGWWVLPHIVDLMTSFVPSGSSSYLDASYYFQFVVKLALAMGVAFVLPVFLVLLNLVGVLSANAMLSGWRVAVLVITIFTAIATPAADIFSMVLLALPLIGLYLVACAFSAFHDRRANRRRDVGITT